MDTSKWYESSKIKHKVIHQAVFKLRALLKAFGVQPRHMKPVNVASPTLTFTFTDLQEMQKYASLHAKTC